MVFGCFSKITVEMSMFRKIRHRTKSSEIVRFSFLNLNLYREREVVIYPSKTHEFPRKNQRSALVFRGFSGVHCKCKCIHRKCVCVCVCMSICRCFLRHTQFSAVFQPSRWCNVRVQPLTATSLGPGLKSCRSTLACLAVCFFLLIFSMVFNTYKHGGCFRVFTQRAMRNFLWESGSLQNASQKNQLGSYPHDLTKISSENPSGYGGLASFSRGRIHISTLISFFTSAKTHGPNRWIPGGCHK